MDLRPGKGLHSILNQNVLDLLKEALGTIEEYYSDEMHDSAPESVILGLSSRAEWQEEKDNFGHKVFRMLPYKKGALRVTVVLTKQNELRLDIREWYDPAAA
jgi:hypothetical protein